MISIIPSSTGVLLRLGQRVPVVGRARQVLAGGRGWLDSSCTMEDYRRRLQIIALTLTDRAGRSPIWVFHQQPRLFEADRRPEAGACVSVGPHHLWRRAEATAA